MAVATNIRVLVPRVRRAVEGPVPPPKPLSDVVLKDIVADALADVILYSGSAFGKTLDVTAIDDVTGAPTEYATSDALSLQEAAVIAAQAALNFFFFKLVSTKTEERITDEAGEWQYRNSPTLLRDALKSLQDARDKALDALKDDKPLESYVSFLAVRDAEVARCIEPWTLPEPGGYMQGHSALILDYDYRFGGF